MSLADACLILRAAAALPVRLTLLHRRHEPEVDLPGSSSTVPNVDQSKYTSIKYIILECFYYSVN